ncbi:DNA repair protein RecN [Thiothrix unzii]|jgi:DNA repair protein RecN (Recombination protein N)|uniref:DNA repair protein RecN n=1 Tax=Thiothrix lacustris TaxID=525917 RepID=A0A1Y1QMH3_9GAMM|nr:DNA repair protein RecN [Thiothrix unzii]MDX9989374.1 DNA repair protein RecN [Thiothrix unzii]OQX09297.1 MAG: DNA repair protein RecN [Thiothrix lacustris]
MLTHIHIRDFAIIETLDLELHAGMTALTGETGAGKSILLDAIGLVLGDKADSNTVRHGADKADLTLSVDITQTPFARDWLETQGMEHEDDTCILRRVITAQGKSRAWINGSPANLTQLRELGEQLVDIHGQHEHQSLMKKDAQRHLLDGFAGNDNLLEHTRNAWQAWKKLHERVTALSQQNQQHQERVELLRFQAHELEALALQADEPEQLDEELNRLANAEQLRATAEQGYAQLYDNEPSLYAILGRLMHDLAQQAQLDNRLEPPLELLTSAQIQVQEASVQLRDYAESLDIDPARLQAVENRIADIRSFARKYRTDPRLLPEKLLSIQTELAQLGGDDYDLETLEKQCQAAADHYRKQASNLSKARIKAAQQLSAGVTKAMQQLGMQGGQFTITVNSETQTAFQASGMDSIEFTVSANPGQPLKSLMKVASGGELSRISLAIQMIAAQKVTLPALIFDEVDTGIGGGIAEVVGKQLRALGTNRQVLCVTHLPQVASQAHQHYKVTKIKGKQHTSTGIEQLSHALRIEEIARMIGGVEITPATRALAEEMLG